MDADDIGRGELALPLFLRFAIDGKDVGPVGGICLGAAVVGGLGAAILGGFGAEPDDDSGSDVYDESLFALKGELGTLLRLCMVFKFSPPVSIPPPRFFSFGIPPANKPPSCGGCSILVTAPEFLPDWSLLLLALFPPPGMGGASPPGTFNIPGTGGAPADTGPGPPDVLPTTGADRSFVTAFLSCLPFDMSCSKAPCNY